MAEAHQGALNQKFREYVRYKGYKEEKEVKKKLKNKYDAIMSVAMERTSEKKEKK